MKKSFFAVSYNHETDEWIVENNSDFFSGDVYDFVLDDWVDSSNSDSTTKKIHEQKLKSIKNFIQWINHPPLTK